MISGPEQVSSTKVSEWGWVIEFADGKVNNLWSGLWGNWGRRKESERICTKLVCGTGRARRIERGMIGMKEEKLSSWKCIEESNYVLHSTKIMCIDIVFRRADGNWRSDGTYHRNAVNLESWENHTTQKNRMQSTTQQISTTQSIRMKSAQLLRRKFLLAKTSKENMVRPRNRLLKGKR